MQTRDKEEIRKAVRESYGKIAKAGNNISGISPTISCCGGPDTSHPDLPRQLHAVVEVLKLRRKACPHSWAIQNKI